MKIYLLHILLYLFLTVVLLCFSNPSFSQSRVLYKHMTHLRRGPVPEWATFPAATNKHLIIKFEGKENAFEQTLSLRQEDVKQAWRILLNGEKLGNLYQDENPLITYWPVPPQMIHSGSNTLTIEQADTIVDDIRVGEVILYPASRQQVLSQATVQITVADKQTGALLPARITITASGNALQTVASSSNDRLAVRPGFVYTGNGKASFGLPAGTYTIYAGRGFEYGIDSIQIVLKPGDNLQRKLSISHEVPTPGWVGADTHIHTFTYSRHGDATLEERALTIAGEGIELPILTDHNIHVDIDSAAKAMGVRNYFTPVVGNELTTKVGHFNLFPVTTDSPIADHQVNNWQTLAQDLSDKNYSHNKAVILNHARDVHHKFRPFGEDRHVAVAGMNVDKWVLPANAMEVVNSGAQQNDRMRLFMDWFGMLNRGYFLTPVGSSDSHDVGRYLVGQARTYIQSKDDNPGQIDVDKAVDNFVAGKVMVSFGLMAQLVVNNSFGPGDLVPAFNEVRVSAKVLGPAWVQARRISLYANGERIRETVIEEGNKAGVKWSGNWILPASKRDFYLVAIAEGPSNFAPFWPIAKPYQPTSTEWQPGVIGASGAIWIDMDGDGKRTSAYAYAKQLTSAFKADIPKLIEQLSSYDEAVALQTAALLQEQGVNLTEPLVVKALQKASPAVKRGFEKFHQAWQVSQVAKKSR